ncbi:Sec23/Sec24 family protein [Hortaea werneckii]|uniref:Sec23/Sec24 trunk domain-containing protein n=1 Tax=Hortaea werneckii TaxID=91943 RepID=A0A3M7I5X8_HORWE|nr:Sec23/Sec24 family protein [Hortaea werneckii]KAI6847496.1 Sec23/Sec24 family protein [Hortaea werneckii]KAI6927424.1 Sec23/Sec24 family protein [Hortaea werneckii]KAI6933527.1 Sec23/Sec24 family protein [Hortaea werneckii]KAI6968072.1 Sec23/Sec24 family protein [Hortaea werneckii]
MSFQIPSTPHGSPFGIPFDERPKPKRTQSGWRPPVAPSPGGYQQGGGNSQQVATGGGVEGSYFPAVPAGEDTASNVQGSAKMQQPGGGYAGAGGYGYGYPPQQDAMGGLAQQMGGMGLDGTAAPQARRKKDRHAYHQIEQPAATAPAPPGQQFMNGSPSVGGQATAPWQQQTQPWQSQALPQAGPGASPAMPQSQPAGTPVSIAQQGTQNMAQGQQGRVNPDQIPSIPLSRDLPAEYYKTHIYPTMEQHLPPPATTPFVAFDQGNASPKYARLTLNCIPSTADQLASTSLPLGLVLQPLAKQTDGEQTIPVLDFGDAGPPRCRRCRAYINPFMIFGNGGNRMTCNLCGHPNEVPADYFAPTDPSGARVDRLQRPELLLGTCEFLVPKEYWIKEPVPQRFLFLIDVSAEAVQRGFLQAVCDGVMTALYGDEATQDGEESSANGDAGRPSNKVPAGARVGFMTYDRTIHFYDTSSSLSAPQQLVVSDLEDPFSAISGERLFVDAAECRENITKLLRSLPVMHSRQPAPETALLPTLNAALSALEATGGKILCSLSSLPTHGPGRLFPRDKGSYTGEDGEGSKDYLNTNHAGFKKLHADMTKAGVGIDFFLSAPMGGYLDIATIGSVAEKTGGETFYYPNFTFPRDNLRLAKELGHTIQRDQGYAALMKVRCSQGLQLAHYSGNFTQHTFGADLELASVTEDSGMDVTFAYDGKLDPKLDAHFQAALLYTTTSGQRRVRCINAVASVSSAPGEPFKFVDQDAVLSILAKEAASKAIDRSLKEIRQNIQDKCIDIIAAYRKNFAGASQAGQLVLPQNLKELAMFVLGLLKSRALKGGKEPSDRRIQEIRMVKAMGLPELSLYLYPRIIALHNLDPSEGFADENGRLKMPAAVRASFAQMEEGGAYLVDNGQMCLLWLHQAVSPNLLVDLFGEGFESLQALDSNLNALPVLQTHLNAQVRNILLHLEEQRGSKGLAIQLARQGLDGAEFEFARLLFEDRNGEASSYVDWLVLLHRGVTLELSGRRAKLGSSEGSGIGDTLSSITGAVPYWG